MTSWAELTVQDLVERGEAELKTGPFGTQLHASDYVEEGTPVINVRNIGFGTLIPEKLEYISDATVQRLSGHLLQPADIVFGRKGAVERHVFIREQQNRWFQGSDCLRLRLNSPDIDPQYISYCFLTDEHKRWMINQCSHGATMASLNQAIIGRISLRLPTISTQRKIAAILSAYDDLIENNARRIKILEEMAQSLYREWFVHFRFPGGEGVRLVESELGPVPEGWDVTTIREVSTYINRGVSPKYDEASERYVINQKCIRDGKLNMLAARRHSSPASRDKVIQFGDVLINSTGIGTLGRVAQVYDKLGDVIVDSHVSIVRANQLVSLDYFGLTLLGLQSYFDSQGVGSTGQTELSRDAVGQAEILLPPKELQDTFSAVVAPMRASMVVLEKKNANLRRTRDLLLPKLISGELDVRISSTTTEMVTI